MTEIGGSGDAERRSKRECRALDQPTRQGRVRFDIFAQENRKGRTWHSPKHGGSTKAQS
jgi:hypothetical protein